MEVLFAILALFLFLIVVYFIIKDVMSKPTIREMKTRINQHQEAIEYYQQQIKKIEYEQCDNQYH